MNGNHKVPRNDGIKFPLDWTLGERPRSPKWEDKSSHICHVYHDKRHFLEWRGVTFQSPDQGCRHHGHRMMSPKCITNHSNPNFCATTRCGRHEMPTNIRLFSYFLPQSFTSVYINYNPSLVNSTTNYPISALLSLPPSLSLSLSLRSENGNNFLYTIKIY